MSLLIYPSGGSDRLRETIDTLAISVTATVLVCKVIRRMSHVFFDFFPQMWIIFRESSFENFVNFFHRWFRFYLEKH